MDPNVATGIVALRPALEDLIARVTADPDALSQPSTNDSSLMNLVRNLSHSESGRHGIAPVQNEDGSG